MNDDSIDTQSESGSERASCDPALTRQEFITKIVKGAALAGGLAATPKILDKFLVPKAYAATSGGTGCGSANAGDLTNGGTDQVDIHGSNVTCAGNGDESQTSKQAGGPDTHCKVDSDISFGCS